MPWISLLLGGLDAAGASGTWNGAGGANTNWVNTTNWVSGTIANGTNTTATFGTATGYNVRLTSAITNGSVVINSASPYNFYASGANFWKLQTTTGNALFTVLQGNHVMNANVSPMLVSTGLVVDIAGGAQLSGQALNGVNATWRTVTKNGNGTWILTSSSTSLFADWLLNAGVLQLSNINGLGNTNSDLTFNGGTLRLGASLDPTYSRTFTVGPAGGKVTFNSTNFSLSINDGNQLTGTGTLELAGTVPQQKMLVSTNQTGFTGTLKVTGGQLQLTHSNALGSGAGKLWLSTNGSATINSFSNRLAISNLTFTGGALSNLSTTAGLAIRGLYSDTLNSTLALNGNVSLPYGPGGLSFENNQANSVYATVVPASATADPVIRATGASTTIDFHNRINVNGATSADFTLVVNNGAAMTFKSAATVNTMINTNTARPFWLRSDAAGAQGSVRFDPGFTATINATNRLYDLSIAGAKWITTASTNLPANSIRFEGQTNGLWRVENTAQTYTKSISVLTNATIDTATDLTVSSLLMTVGGVTLTKIGSGTLRLETGTYTSANPTTLRIIQGYARLNAIWADAGPSPSIDLQSGATLGGTGKANAVTSTGGILRPGIGLIPGSYAQFSAKSITLDSASTVDLHLGGTGVGQFDSLRLTTGNLILANGNLSITLDPGFSASVNSKMRIADLTNGLSTISGTFNGLPQNALITSGAFTFSISYTGGTGNDIELTTVVPEGKHVALAAAAGLGVWAILRRRQLRGGKGSPAADGSPPNFAG